MLRITGGQAKGRLLKTLPGRHIRPTGNRVRQAVFNILQGQVSDRPVVDLFAGSGVMGLEALSRGAAYAIFIESDRRAASIIAENIGNLGYQDRSCIIRQDVFAAAPNITGHAWNGIVFADPPYGRGYTQRVVELVAARLGAEGLFILEHHVDDLVQTDSLPSTINCIDQRRYGTTMVSFFTLV